MRPRTSSAGQRAAAKSHATVKLRTMTEVSWTQRLVLILLIGASVAVFCRRLSAVLNIIRRSRPTSDFHLAPLGPRIRDFLWEVAAQGKVIRQRPLPGL